MMQSNTHNQIKSLTGIRGLAALYVVVYHIPLWSWSQSTQFIRHGYLAVDLFFVLSGFVMGMTYAGLFAQGFSPRHYGTFLIRRLARVYPLYLLVACTYGFAMWAGLIDSYGFRPTWRTLLANILMIQAWGLTGSILGPLWSISTEWAAYLLFPVLAAAFLFSRWRIALALCACAFLVLLGLALTPTPSPADVRSGPLDISWIGSPLPVVRCLVEFSLGLVAFRAAGRIGMQAFAGRPLVAPVVVCAILLLLAWPGTDLVVVALMPPLIVGLVHGRGPVQVFLGWQPVFVLGELSYAIYLLHPRLTTLYGPPAALLAQWVGKEAAWRISFIAVLLACAWLTHKLVEKPCRNALRGLERWFGQNERKAVSASETAGRATLP